VASTDAPSSPSFAKPPLEEVALAIQFQPQAIDTLTAAHFSELIAADFPKQEEQLARPPISEEFLVGAQPQFRFEVIPAPSMPRFWFLSESGTRLVQVQSDLIAYNWQRSPGGIPTDEAYPRYTTLREEFEARIAALEESVEKRGKDPLKPNWCEVTYINHIHPTPGEENRPHFSELLRGVAVPLTGGFLPSPADVGLNLRFVIPGGSTGPLGRLTVALTTAVRTTDGAPIWVMTLTVRVLDTEKETMAAALKTLDIGHDWIVNGFAELTSDDMHAVWERNDQPLEKP
jgi:uncharacterized protein (TIGR04255 family)